jgi:hypothetical protein
MNTNLIQVIIQTIEESKQVLGEGFDFAKEQTPLVIQEFLRWKFWEHSLLAAIYLAAALIALWVVLKYTKTIAREMEELCLLPLGGLLLIIAGTSYGFFSQAFNAIQITIAPRVYLIEFAADVLKGAQ